MSFKHSISNEQAFRALASGDYYASSVILCNFIFYTRSRAGFFIATNYDLCLEFCELESIGNLGLINAIKLYRGDAIPFAPFAIVVIQNAMLNYIKQMRSPTAKQLSHGLSLDDLLFEDNKTLLFSDVVTDSDCDQELGIYRTSDIGYFEDLLPKKLNELEIDVIKRKLKGYTYQEIRKELDLPKRKLDSTISKLKEKWFADS